MVFKNVKKIDLVFDKMLKKLVLIYKETTYNLHQNY